MLIWSLQCNLMQHLLIVSNWTTHCVMQDSKGPFVKEESSILQLHVSAQTLAAVSTFNLLSLISPTHNMSPGLCNKAVMLKYFHFLVHF